MLQAQAEPQTFPDENLRVPQHAQAADDQPPWNHLRHPFSDPSLPLNQWREEQYRAAFEGNFIIEQWLTAQDKQAEALLTPEIQAELAEYSPEELTRQEIVILARKKN